MPIKILTKQIFRHLSSSHMNIADLIKHGISSNLPFTAVQRLCLLDFFNDAA